MLGRAVAYLNVDICVSGDNLSVSTSPSLATLWRGVLRDLNGTEHGTKFSNAPWGEIRDANTDWILNQPEIGVLGSGSDFTVFLDHLGIPSLDFSFEKHTTYGQYHSIYDSFAWIDAYGGIEGQVSSSFHIIEFAAKVWGLLALRLADTAVLPLDHLAQGEALLHYVDAIEKQQTGLELKELFNAVSLYQEAAAKTQVACQSGNEQHDRLCNEKLGLTERHFLSTEGLPQRPWFKHILQAPGMYLGYAAESFPGIQQALDEGNTELAEEQVQVAVERVASAASFLRLGDTNREE
jgi:N-acetylated-alpha-linked acidic dipeptidase